MVYPAHMKERAFNVFLSSNDRCPMCTIGFWVWTAVLFSKSNENIGKYFSCHLQERRRISKNNGAQTQKPILYNGAFVWGHTRQPDRGRYTKMTWL